MLRIQLLLPFSIAFLCAGADKPLPIHFFPPVTIEPPKVAAGDPISNRCADASQPCYANNKDILRGNRTILNTQDVTFDAFYQIGSVNTQNALTVHTSASTFGQQFDDNFEGTGFPITSLKTVSARLIRGQGPFPFVGQYYIDDIGQTRALLATLADDTQTGIGTFQVGLGGRVPYDSIGLKVYAGIGDFAGDGRDEVVLAAHDSICIVAAKDPTNISAGLIFPACTRIPPNPDGTLQRSFGIGIGHFGSDVLRIAVLNATAAQTSTPNALISFYNVDAKTFELTFSGTTPLPFSTTALNGLAVAAGRFTTTGYDQLAVLGTTTDSNVELIPLDFGNDGTTKPGSRTSLGDSNSQNVMAAAAGYFGAPETPVQQLVFTLAQPGKMMASAGVITFNTLFQPSTPVATSVSGCFVDLITGNFDHVQPDPSRTGATIRDPRDQVMVLSVDAQNGSCGGTARLSIFNPTLTATGQPQIAAPDSQLAIPPPNVDQPYASPMIYGATIGAVDTQGRSLLLGEPSIVTFLERQKISQIVAMPPMHIDAIPTGGGSGGALTLYNFTAGPSGYKASFDLGTQTSNSLSTKHTTTWSFAAEESVGGSVAVGLCGDDEDEDVDCARASTKVSAKQALDGSTATDNSSSSSLEYQLNGMTSDSDLILYSGSFLTDYIYPVVGKTVCPGGASTCDPSSRVPETVQFAGADSVVKQAGAGIDLLWYQPVWMFGNVLSYPTNECQLEIDSFGACGTTADSAGTLEELSGQLTLSADFNGVETNTWIRNKSSGSTTAFNQNYSFDVNTSVSAEANEIFASEKVDASLDLSGSYGVQNLVDSRTESQASNGIQFTKTSVFQTAPSSSTWGYDITSRIFGQKQPLSVPDVKAPNNSDSPSTPDITSFGTFRTAFVVNPSGVLYNTGEGGWYGTGTDIGLNQPRRWYYYPGQTANNECLLTSVGNSQADCVALSKTDSNPFQDDFHSMRGFFVIPATKFGKQPLATGPQVERVKYNDQIILRVRVYNFSTVDTRAGQSIHARFYATPIGSNSAINTSVFLGEGTAASISHWGSDTNEVNWTFIDLPFTPGVARAGQDLAFWVVVWAENPDGSLVPDLSGHGLTSKPPQDIQWDAIKTYEQSYSNNVGFYSGLVYVLGENSDLAAAESSNTSLAITSAAVERSVIRLGDSTKLIVRAQTGDAAIHVGMNFKFYDGDPRYGGKLVGLRRLPYLRAKETYEVGVNFRPREKGQHELFVSVGESTKFQHSVQIRTVTVLPQD